MSSRFFSVFGSIAAINEKQLKGWSRLLWNSEMFECLKTYLCSISYREQGDKEQRFH